MTGLKAMILALFVLFGGIANADPNAARKAWSAFSCAVFAELSGKPSEQERLFKLGYTSARRFVADMAASPQDESIREGAPVGILLLLEGPSEEFIVGRIFESVTEHAYDQVVKRDSAGKSIHEPAKWLVDEELKKSRANHLYRERNCELVK
jgi:hypothetical protein